MCLNCGKDETDPLPSHEGRLIDVEPVNIFDPRITAALRAAEEWNAAMDRLETMLGDDDRAAAAAATLVEMTPRELSDAVLREAIASLRRVAIDLRADRDLGAAMRCEQIIREHEAALAARSAR